MIDYSSGMRCLETLLAPIDAQAFLDTFYEKKICHIQRDDPGYYADLLSLEGIDALLGTSRIPVGEGSMVRAATGQLEPREISSDGRHLCHVKVLEKFDAGATLILDHLHNRVPKLRQLCAHLAQVFRCRFQTNVYVTPPNSQGFPPHWDTHDVFVLQVEGEKRWKFYDTPIRLPVALAPHEFKKDEYSPGELTSEVTLRPGDLLYVPRGLVHAAVSSDTASVHITTGMLGVTWFDLFNQGNLDACLDSPEFRENLPVSLVSGALGAPAAAEAIRRKVEQLVPYLLKTDLVGKVWESILPDQRPDTSGLLAQRRGVAALSGGSICKIRGDVLLTLRAQGDEVVVCSLGREISFPKFVQPLLDRALAGDSFQIDQLPGSLDLDGRLTVVRRLIREGLLVAL